MPPDRVVYVSEKFKEKGQRLLFFARFMPGLRTAVFFSAGTLRIPFRTFFLYDGIAALISVPTIILVAHTFGGELETLIKKVRKVEGGVIIFVAVILLFVSIKWYYSHKKMKRLKKD